jgi:hypothetical protein
MNRLEQHKIIIAVRSLFTMTLVITAFIGPRGINAVGRMEAANPNDTVARRRLACFLERLDRPDGADRYLLRSGDDAIWLWEDAIWLQHFPKSSLYPVDPVEPGEAAPGVNLRLSFVGANQNPRLEPFMKLKTQVSYFLGADPLDWRAAQPAWGALRYRDLYSNIDLVIDTTRSGLEARMLPWRLEAHKGADLSTIKLRVEGLEGLGLLDDGLLLQTQVGSIQLPALRLSWDGLMQEQPNLTIMFTSVERINQGIYELGSVEVVGQGNSRIPAEAGDQDLVYSSFLGGSDLESGYAVAVDGTGAAYVVGRTRSVDFPLTPGAFDTTASQFDVFVAKLNPAGDGLVYASYLGGSSLDFGRDIALDGTVVYLTGETWSHDFPESNDISGEADVFVVSLTADGTRINYATLLGGGEQDIGYGIAVQAGEAYVSGITRSSDFPAEGYQRDGDAFAIKLDNQGNLSYATLLAGSDVDAAFAVAVVDGEAYLAGETSSMDFAPVGYQGGRDAFVAKLDKAGEREYVALVGGGGDDSASAIAVDSNGRVFLTGFTDSPNFSTGEGSLSGGRDAFVSRFDPNGALDLAAYLGGADDDEGRGIALDANGNILLTGATASDDFPLTANPFQSVHRGVYDVFLARFDFQQSPSNRLTYATFLGGEGDDRAYDIAVDWDGLVYLTGYTTSSDFPTTEGAFDLALGGSQDAFVSKFAPGDIQVPLITTQKTSTPTSTATRVPTQQSPATSTLPAATLQSAGTSAPLLTLTYTPLASDTVAHTGGVSATPYPTAQIETQSAMDVALQMSPTSAAFEPVVQAATTSAPAAQAASTTTTGVDHETTLAVQVTATASPVKEHSLQTAAGTTLTPYSLSATDQAAGYNFVWVSGILVILVVALGSWFVIRRKRE